MLGNMTIFQTQFLVFPLETSTASSWIRKTGHQERKAVAGLLILITSLWVREFKAPQMVNTYGSNRRKNGD